MSAAPKSRQSIVVQGWKQNEHTPKHLRVVAALKRPDGN